MLLKPVKDNQVLLVISNREYRHSEMISSTRVTMTCGLDVGGT